MKTREFIQSLRNAADKALIFTNAAGDMIHAGYHLTEIKAATFETVDCGGQLNHWNETILQLWVPEEADGDYMKSDKFLRIYNKVRGMVPVDEEAEVRIEYGDENFSPATYRVSEWRSDNSSIRFLLEPPATTCKARDRRRVGEKAESCCA